MQRHVDLLVEFYAIGINIRVQASFSEHLPKHIFGAIDEAVHISRAVNEGSL